MGILILVVLAFAFGVALVIGGDMGAARVPGMRLERKLESRLKEISQAPEERVAGEGELLKEPESGPLPALDRILRGGHESCTDQQPEDVVAVAVATERPDGHPRPHRLTVGRRRDESQHHRTQLGTLLDRQALVQAVSRTGNGTTDLTRRPISVDRQHAAVTTPPRLRQSV